MRIVLCLAAGLLLSLPVSAQAPTPECPPGNSECAAKPPSKADLKKAKKRSDQAQDFYAKGKFHEALDALDQAIEWAPGSVEYRSQREMVRQRLVSLHIERGNAFLSSEKRVEASAEFRQALALDPKNEFALQRLQDSLPFRPTTASDRASLSPALTVASQSKAPALEPASTRTDFHFRGTSRNLLEQVAAAFGVKVLFDESVTNRQVRLDLEKVDFYSAMEQAQTLAHVFWVPLGPKQMIIANNTPAVRREFERMAVRTFYIGDATAPQDLNDVVNLLRTVFDIRFVSAQTNNHSVIARAPVTTLDSATQLVETFLSRKPQVSLDVQVFQISSSFARQLGINLPLTFQMINLPAAALAALQSPNTQDLINQLISSGGINQANNEAVQALLAQLQNQQNSLLQTPFATFGGGQTLFAVTIPPLTANFQVNKSDVQSISRLTLRTAQGNAAVMKLGTRYPILNASFAPLFNTAAISQVIRNGSFVAPFPSFTYEDLGINLKATPQVLSDGSVFLKLELAIKSLTGQSLNGVPVISNREYVGSMSLQAGEPAFVIGMISQSEQKSVSGIPGTQHIPILRDFTTFTSKEVKEDELLVVVTPYVVSAPRTKESNREIWLSGN